MRASVSSLSPSLPSCSATSRGTLCVSGNCGRQAETRQSDDRPVFTRSSVGRRREPDVRPHFRRGRATEFGPAPTTSPTRIRNNWWVPYAGRGVCDTLGTGGVSVSRADASRDNKPRRRQRAGHGSSKRTTATSWAHGMASGSSTRSRSALRSRPRSRGVRYPECTNVALCGDA
jgi:hypothetical protein